jgi:hypothetical protein
MDISKYRDFYRERWDTNNTLSDDQLDAYIMKACDNISNALFILSVDNANVPAVLSDTFCSAICAETEYIMRSGNSGETDAEFDSVQIGSFRMSGMKSSGASETSSKTAGGICTRAEEYLAKTGLYSRLVSVV